MEVVIIILYLIPTIILFSYSCAQLSLVWNYWFKSPQSTVRSPQLAAVPLSGVRGLFFSRCFDCLLDSQIRTTTANVATHVSINIFVRRIWIAF